MSKYYYEKSGILDSAVNITYHELFLKDDKELDEWITEVRDYIIEDWDVRGTPPMVGQSIEQIISSFKKLREYDIHGFIEKADDGQRNVIKNFNKFANGVNQFFPTMLKTRIGDMGDVTLNSIYDRIKEDVNKDLFFKALRRGLRRDSMYSFSKSLSKDRKENEKNKLPYWNGESAVEWLKYYQENKLKFKDHRLWISKSHQEKYLKNYVTITADEIKQAYKDGLITDEMVTNLWCPTLKVKLSIDDVTDNVLTKGGNNKTNVFMIRFYDIEKKLFPSAFQIFRLSLNSQPAVNFPPLTARLLYEKYTDHIKQDEPLNIYDPSSGWGGRILGAMASKKRIHYIGTDPNTDNWIPELNKSRYEYVADFFNEHGLETNAFWEEPKNTYHYFCLGSEHVGDHPDYQQYKGKLDMVFTSPPYFDREQYSEDDEQSFKSYPMYSDWRDNFLKPTLTNAYESLRNDRYLLWNIADIKIGKDKYHHLEQDSIDIVESLGGQYKGKLKMLMTRMIGLDPSSSGIKNSVKLVVSIISMNQFLVFIRGRYVWYNRW